MKRLREFIGVIFVGMVILVFSTEGFSTTEPPYYLKSGKPFVGQEITVLHHDCSHFLGTEKRTGEFEKLTGIKVKYVRTPFPTLYEKLATELVAGEHTIDVYDFACFWINELGRFMLPLDERIKADRVPADFPEGVKQMCIYEGRMAFMPLRSHATITFYRKDIFAELGLLPPDTFEDMVTAAKKVQENTDLAGLSLSYGMTSPTAMDNLKIWWPMIIGLGGDWFDAEMRPIFNNEIGMKATKRFVGFLLEDQICPVGAVGFTLYESVLSFQHGKSAMYMGLEWPCGGFMDPNVSPIVGKFGFSPFPRWENRKERGALISGHVWGIAKDSPRVDAAWEYLKWASSAPLQKAIAMAGESAQVNHTSGHLDEELNRKFNNLFKVKLEGLKQGRTFPLIPELSEVSSILSPAISAIATGKSLEDALSEAAAEIEKAMTRAGYYQ